MTDEQEERWIERMKFLLRGEGVPDEDLDRDARHLLAETKRIAADHVTRAAVTQ